MELLSGEKYQGFRARCKDVARCHAKRIGPIKARSLRKRAGTDQIGSRTQGGCGEIKFSQARSVRRRCDHVPNCHRHRCNFRAYKETPVLVCEFAVRGSWMRICGTRRDRKLTALPKWGHQNGKSVGAPLGFRVEHVSHLNSVHIIKTPRALKRGSEN